MTAAMPERRRAQHRVYYSPTFADRRISAQGLAARERISTGEAKDR